MFNDKLDIFNLVSKKTATVKEQMVIYEKITEYIKFCLPNDNKVRGFEWFESPIRAHEKYPVLGYENACLGVWDVYWLYYYNKVDQDKTLQQTFNLSPTALNELARARKLAELSQLCGMFWVTDNLIVATNRPTKYHTITNDNGQQVLHNLNGPAITYPDGTGFYSVRGQPWPASLNYVIDMNSDELADKITNLLEIKNAEHRTVALSKVNIEKVFDKLDKTALAIEGDYVLYNLKFGQNDRVYLKMVCPSSGKVSVEGVPPTIKTIDEALHWRETGELVPGVKYLPPKIRT